jgi:hypothetical protein
MKYWPNAAQLVAQPMFTAQQLLDRHGQITEIHLDIRLKKINGYRSNPPLTSFARLDETLPVSKAKKLLYIV